ncbi:hypothetical protein E8E13_001799 [Curvularia kusanoi]|uniref:Uncharacterized protein n=1 Tax=Curvularia kusanoi TaxID=90978 RepID=A0A9P4T4S4_CURKU|nr:hypothetical protein E8E13_001799 [Curvularia kusanoi]
MSDNDTRTGAQPTSAAAWTDTERMAYLIVVAEHALGTSLESKVYQAPRPNGRTVIACRNIVLRLKKKLKDDIENIKTGKVVASSPTKDEDAVKKGARKRKAQDEEAEIPKKKPASRKKSEVAGKDELEEELI